MRFRKKGSDVRTAVQDAMDHTRKALDETKRYFERQKEKGALARIRELELQIDRLERIQRNLVDTEVYELTEKDLEDFRL